MRRVLTRHAWLVALPATLVACGGSTATAPNTPRPQSTRAHQVVLQATLPSRPSPGQTLLPTPKVSGSHGTLPTVPPVPTATAIPASAYTAVIYGTVTDRKTGSPVPGAIVTVNSAAHTKKTSAYGQYRFAFPAGVAAPVTVSASGYAGALAMGNLKPHQSVQVNFKLVRIVPGKPVIPPLPTTFGRP